MLVLLVVFLGVQAVAKSCSVVVPDAEQKPDTIGNTMLKSLAEEMGSRVYGQFLPSVAFSEESSHRTCWLLQAQIHSLLPFYGFIADRTAEDREVSLDFRTLLLAEAEEGEYGSTSQEQFPSEEGSALGGSGGKVDAIGQTTETMGAGQWAGEGSGNNETGQWATGQGSGNSVADQWTTGQGSGNSGTDQWTDSVGGAELGDLMDNVGGETLEELLRAENEAALQMQISSFIPHGIQNQVSLEALRDYNTLIQQFYSVDANTMAGSDQLNVNQFLQADMTIPKDSPGPQILIYHTHSQEAFSDSVQGDESTSIMGVGDRLTEILTLDYGYEVLHHRGKYDVESRDNAYANALPDIEQVLKANPTIQVVIDLHRDEMPEGTRLVMDLDGRPTARFMFFNGLSRTKKTGNIAYLYNENLDSNLAFSFQMQLKALEYYPGLTRKIYLKGYRYNMHLSSKYLLIELGAQNNTVEEAMNACDPLAHILDMVLSGEG